VKRMNTGCRSICPVIKYRGSYMSETVTETATTHAERVSAESVFKKQVGEVLARIVGNIPPHLKKPLDSLLEATLTIHNVGKLTKIDKTLTEGLQQKQEAALAALASAIKQDTLSKTHLAGLVKTPSYQTQEGLPKPIVDRIALMHKLTLEEFEAAKKDVAELAHEDAMKKTGFYLFSIETAMTQASVEQQKNGVTRV